MYKSSTKEFEYFIPSYCLLIPTILTSYGLVKITYFLLCIVDIRLSTSGLFDGVIGPGSLAILPSFVCPSGPDEVVKSPLTGVGVYVYNPSCEL
jgi:hypothetical protein